MANRYAYILIICTLRGGRSPHSFLRRVRKSITCSRKRSPSCLPLVTVDASKQKKLCTAALLILSTPVAYDVCSNTQFQKCLAYPRLRPVRSAVRSLYCLSIGPLSFFSFPMERSRSEDNFHIR